MIVIVGDSFPINESTISVRTRENVVNSASVSSEDSPSMQSSQSFSFVSSNDTPSENGHPKSDA